MTAVPMTAVAVETDIVMLRLHASLLLLRLPEYSYSEPTRTSGGAMTPAPTTRGRYALHESMRAPYPT